jgi:hypothetical protein
MFNWHDGFFQVLLPEVGQFRREVLFSHLERIRRLFDSGNRPKMMRAIHDLLRFNVYCGLLFNQEFLTALACMTVEQYDDALTCLVRAKKHLPDELFYDELISQCRKASGIRHTM